MAEHAGSRLDRWLDDVVDPPADPPVIGRPPGLVGDIAHWVVRTARFPDWEMAIAVGIAVVGAAMAPTVVGPTLSSTVTYQLILGGSASGKQHPQNCIERLLPFADAKVSTGRYNSAAGLEEDIKGLQHWFCFFDEFGDWLEQLTHKNAAAGPLWGVV